MEVLVALGDDLKDWRKTKKQMSLLLDSDIAEKHLAYKNPCIQEAITMHQTQLQLHKAFMASPVNSKAVGFVAHPAGVCSLQHFAAGALVLKPYGNLYPLKDQEKDKVKILVGNFGISPPKMISEFDKIDSKSVLVPFWYVKSTLEEELVNMHLEAKQVQNLTLPCYVNTVALEPGAVLLCEHENLTKKRKKREENNAAAAKAEASAPGKKRKS